MIAEGRMCLMVGDLMINQLLSTTNIAPNADIPSIVGYPAFRNM